jgi:nitroreductase
MKTLFSKQIYLLLLLVILFSHLVSAAYSAPISPAEIFIKRHSGKSYDPTKDVSHEQMLALIEATRWAPSSYNEQPWYFIFCDKFSNPEAYLKALESFKDMQGAWVEKAPLLVIIIAQTMSPHNNKLNKWAEYDTGAAAVSMALQASELGLMAHQIGGFNKGMIRENFKLSEDDKPLVIMLIGYEKEDPKTKPRIRKPIDENFFLGEWGNGFGVEK